MIRFLCDSCNQKIKVEDQYVGSKVKCPKCSSVLVVPCPQPDIEPDELVLKTERTASFASDPPEITKVEPNKDDNLYNIFEESGNSVHKSGSNHYSIKEETKDCPSCGGKIADSAVVCISCGYDFRKAKKNKTVLKRRPSSDKCDPYGRTPVPGDRSAPRYFGVNFIAFCIKWEGLLTIGAGIFVIFAGIDKYLDTKQSGRSLEDLFIPLLIGIGVICGGTFIYGIGQLFAAFRDMVINSYLQIES